MLLINDKNFRECPGVYIIKNIITGKEYIGESLNIKRRFGVHARLKSGQRIHKSILKHGIENFQVYCEYFPDLKKEELLQIEEQMIKDYNTLIPNGYNISTGKWYKVCDQFLKRKKSKNHGRNISKAKKGIPLSNEHKLALSKAHTGKKLSSKHKKSVSDALKNYYENKDPISEKMLDQLRYNRKDLVSVVQLDDDGNIVNEFKSIREAERITGVRNSHITSVCKGKRPKAGSFVWKYKHSV